MISFKLPLGNARPFHAALMLAALFIPQASAPSARAETAVKFATLAPEGSTWMKVMDEYNKELIEKTGGQVRFKFYPGGVSGDEKDVVRKIRLGQLHAAGLTGVGLGEIAPQLRILDTPLLFRDAREVDAALKAFGPELRRTLQDRGFLLLGWSEVGFVYVFTNHPVRAPSDMKATKMWAWEGDPIAEATFKAFGVHPIPLSVTDVMASLQTGLVNGVYASPMAAIALQWFAKTKYVGSVPLAYACGAVLVSKKLADGLTAEQRRLLLELGDKHMGRLTLLGRRENVDAMKTLGKEGLSLADPAPEEVLKQYEEAGAKARRSLAGRLYSAELLDRMEKVLAGLRTGTPGTAAAPAPVRGKLKSGHPKKG